MRAVQQSIPDQIACNRSNAHVYFNPGFSVVNSGSRRHRPMIMFLLNFGFKSSQGGTENESVGSQKWPASEVSNNRQTPGSTTITTSKCLTPRSRTYQKQWEQGREWHFFKETKGLMFCQICKKYFGKSRNNNFIKGCESLRLNTTKKKSLVL